MKIWNSLVSFDNGAYFFVGSFSTKDKAIEVTEHWLKDNLGIVVDYRTYEQYDFEYANIAGYSIDIFKCEVE